MLKGLFPLTSFYTRWSSKFPRLFVRHQTPQPCNASGSAWFAHLSLSSTLGYRYGISALGDVRLWIIAEGKMKDKERWKELYGQAAVEQDPKNVEEITRLLDEKQNRLRRVARDGDETRSE